jgi:hypothetical protein
MVFSPDRNLRHGPECKKRASEDLGMGWLKCQSINDLAGTTTTRGGACPCSGTHDCVGAATEKTRDGTKRGDEASIVGAAARLREELDPGLKERKLRQEAFQ